MSETVVTDSNDGNSAFDELKKIIETLGDDLRKCNSELNLSDNQFRRRATVRVLFAFIEGVSNGMKGVALACSGQLSAKFSVAEQAVLLGKTYSLDDDGHVKTQEMKTRTPDNVKFAFKVFAQTFSTDYSLDLSGKGWNAFKESLKIRDRLMHPKTSDSLTVTDEEMKTLSDAYKWFEESITKLMERAGKTLEAFKKKLSGDIKSPKADAL